ncbi:endonuclease/exonuclease/phosphatase family protein [Kribbella sp. NPDC026611]|uniref:endonuclease/exonuclease/phosphatase family protein n=1 Tax=Kribbella sp. NPDC026611 TaxID=3154911 RepID=UPI0033D7E22E
MGSETGVGTGTSSVRSRRYAGLLVGGLLPWAWFLVRDRLGVVTDVAAILLPLLAAGTALVVGLLGRRRRALVAFAISTLLVGIVGTVVPWIPDGVGAVDTSRGVRIAAGNIGIGELDGADNLLALKADVLVVSEIGPPLTGRLSQSYPEQVHEWNGPAIGIFSRWPLEILERPGPDLPGFMLRVKAPSGDFDVIAVHVPRPWWTSGGSTYNSSTDNGASYQTTVAGHHRLIEQIALRVERAEQEHTPVVVTGDLNTTDRGRDYRVLTKHLDDAMLDRWGRPSEIGKWTALMVRIDHLFVSPGWCADDSEWYPIPVSDHNGLAATIGPCRR